LEIFYDFIRVEKKRRRGQFIYHTGVIRGILNPTPYPLSYYP